MNFNFKAPIVCSTLSSSSSRNGMVWISYSGDECVYASISTASRESSTCSWSRSSAGDNNKSRIKRK